MPLNNKISSIERLILMYGNNLYRWRAQAVGAGCSVLDVAILTEERSPKQRATKSIKVTRGSTADPLQNQPFNSVSCGADLHFCKSSAQMTNFGVRVKTIWFPLWEVC